MTNKQDFHGILLLDKPIGLTSNAALQLVKKTFRVRKVGHTGSLDPIASGMLPLCFGEATKFSQFLLESDKRYRVVAKLGATTASGDSETTPSRQREVKDITLQNIEKILAQFRGEITQIPPMYSALKHKGQPLYKLARQGIEIERLPRKVNIFKLHLLNLDKDVMELEIHCSKGTYIRTLVVDIGEALDCGAYVVALRRLSVGNYRESQMVKLDELQDLATHLLSIESMVADMPEVILTREMIYYASLGQLLWLPHAAPRGWVKLKSKDGKFLGVGESVEDGKIVPRKMLRITEGSSS